MSNESCVCYGHKGKQHVRGAKRCIWNGIPEDLWHTSHANAQAELAQRQSSKRLAVATVADDEFGEYEPVIKPASKDATAVMNSLVDDEQQAAVKQMALDLHQVNSSIMRCIDLGLSVQINKVTRHHTSRGSWGELMIPIVVKQNQSKEI